MTALTKSSVVPGCRRATYSAKFTDLSALFVNVASIDCMFSEMPSRSMNQKVGMADSGRAAAEISVADVLRCVDGPLASVRDMGLGDLPYAGPTAALTDVWRALRASMRAVLEQTSLADVAAGALPDHVRALACDYLAQEGKRGRPGD